MSNYTSKTQPKRNNNIDHLSPDYIPARLCEPVILRSVDRNYTPNVVVTDTPLPAGHMLVGRAPVSAFKHPNKRMDGDDSSSTKLVVNPGEDVAQKISEFAQNAPRVTTVVSGSGVVASVTIHENSCTRTYEGPFKILSLTGSYVPSPNDYEHKTGELAIVFDGKQGNAIGGRVSGSLIATTPVQVIVKRFRGSRPLNQEFTRLDEIISLDM